jgi:hypothetical protein
LSLMRNQCACNQTYQHFFFLIYFFCFNDECE